MNACPPLFESLPASDGQSGEYDICSLFQQDIRQSREYDFYSSLFQQDIGFAHADMILYTAENATEFRRGVPSAKSSDSVDKKCLHRVVERKRRIDMISRYSELRSLLPEENIRGKTSINDQLSEATSYIRVLQEKVEQLKNKRDKMKMNHEVHSYKGNKLYNAVSWYESEAFPVVNVNNLGSYVVVTANTWKEQILFSKLLLAVEEGGLQVLTASSFRNRDKIFHTVQCKVSDTQNFISSAKLYQKLSQLIGRRYIQDEACVPLVQGQANNISMPAIHNERRSAMDIM